MQLTIGRVQRLPLPSIRAESHHEACRTSPMVWGVRGQPRIDLDMYSRRVAASRAYVTQTPLACFCTYNEHPDYSWGIETDASEPKVLASQ
jgi:hypothetical protein